MTDGCHPQALWRSHRSLWVTHERRTSSKQFPYPWTSHTHKGGRGAPVFEGGTPTSQQGATLRPMPVGRWRSIASLPRQRRLNILPQGTGCIGDVPIDTPVNERAERRRIKHERTDLKGHTRGCDGFHGLGEEFFSQRIGAALSLWRSVEFRNHVHEPEYRIARHDRGELMRLERGAPSSSKSYIKGATLTRGSEAEELTGAFPGAPVPAPPTACPSNTAPCSSSSASQSSRVAQSR